MIIDENKVLLSVDTDIDIDENGLCIVPFGVKEIGEGTFSYNSKLEKIILPDTVDIIGSSALRAADILRLLQCLIQLSVLEHPLLKIAPIELI
jgi:hypothetical protein